MEMPKELREKIHFLYKQGQKAKKDGYVVAEGYVWEGWGNPTGPCARKVCKIEDYRSTNENHD